jgi:SAM-dependent methyltransferase
LGEIRPGKTCVYFCEACTHVQTQFNVETYYDNYDLLLSSPEEDQLYEVREGKKVFRTDHQLELFKNKTPSLPNNKILDFGCGKGGFLQKLVKATPQLEPYCFEVSDRYKPYWQTFSKSQAMAVGDLPASWKGQLGTVVSFFAFEHTPDPIQSARSIWETLADDGIFYFAVPCFLNNPADFIVADHIHHYTPFSLKLWLAKAGFVVLDVDMESHRGAYLVTARKAKSVEIPVLENEGRKRNLEKIRQTQAYWNILSSTIRQFESSEARGKNAAIYGAGFYGTFIASCLESPQKLSVFLDQDPFRQGKNCWGKPIVSPDQLPKETEVIYVGLNPLIARSVIADISALDGVQASYFFL